jgi:hypothetical protein
VSTTPEEIAVEKIAQAFAHDVGFDLEHADSELQNLLRHRAEVAYRAMRSEDE